MLKFEASNEGLPKIEGVTVRHFKPSKINADTTAENSDTWASPDLSLLGTGRRAAPEFPIMVFGPFWSDWVARRAAGASAPPDYVGVALLAAAGSLLANVRWPRAGANWSEPPVLWCAAVGSPSSSKSPAIDAVVDLVRRIEEDMAVNFDADLRAHETAKATAKARRDGWEEGLRAAVKAGDTPPPMPLDAVAPVDPVRPRLRVADVTTEKLAALAAGLPRGLLVVRDELSGYLGGFDRYGGGGSDRAFALEMFGGRSYTIDRVKSPEPIRIRNLSVGLLGGVQPDKLALLTDGPDDGLAARLLWAWPEALPHFQLCHEVANDEAAQAALTRVLHLAQGTDDDGLPQPIRLRLTNAAELVLEAFAREVAIGANDAIGMYAGHLGKARGYAMRLALVLEFLWWSSDGAAPEPTEVSADAMTAASRMLRSYFIPMAERVFGDAAIPAAERAAMTLARHLRKSGRATFNAREARREIGGKLRESATMGTACDALVEAAIIRPRFQRAGDGAGRRAKDFDINPALNTAPPCANSANSANSSGAEPPTRHFGANGTIGTGGGRIQSGAFSRHDSGGQCIISDAGVSP